MVFAKGVRVNMMIDFDGNKVVFDKGHIFSLLKSSVPGNITFGGIVKKRFLKEHFSKFKSFERSKADQETYDYLESGGMSFFGDDEK